MDVKAKDIIQMIEDIAPEFIQKEWDNSGLQVGDVEKNVSGILLTMDITDKSVDYAISNNLDFILSHHPFFFKDLKSIDYSSYKGKLIKKIIENELIIYSAHTNLDASEKGVNYELAKKMKLDNITNFSKFIEGEDIGVVGELDNATIETLLNDIRNISSDTSIRLYGKMKDTIGKVAIIGGSGNFGIDIAISLGVDVLVTGDIKHHDGQKAYENGLLLIDIGHFYSEFPVLSMLNRYISNSINIKIEIFTDPVYIIR